MLPAKLTAGKIGIFQDCPEKGFGRCEVLAKLLATRFEGCFVVEPFSH